jgi:hypothetical protein
LQTAISTGRRKETLLFAGVGKEGLYFAPLSSLQSCHWLTHEYRVAAEKEERLLWAVARVLTADKVTRLKLISALNERKMRL